MNKKDQEHIKMRIKEFGDHWEKIRKQAEETTDEEEKKALKELSEKLYTITDAYMVLYEELKDKNKK